MLGKPAIRIILALLSRAKTNSEVLIVDDLRQYLAKQYQADGITDGEITKIVQQQLQSPPASDPLPKQQNLLPLAQ